MRVDVADVVGGEANGEVSVQVAHAGEGEGLQGGHIEVGGTAETVQPDVDVEVGGGGPGGVDGAGVEPLHQELERFGCEERGVALQRFKVRDGFVEPVGREERAKVGRVMPQ